MLAIPCGFLSEPPGPGDYLRCHKDLTQDLNEAWREAPPEGSRHRAGAVRTSSTVSFRSWSEAMAELTADVEGVAPARPSTRPLILNALDIAQQGKRHQDAKPLSGFGGASVLEVVEDHDSDTYRAVYTVRFTGAVYVLHTFQKKSKKGIATPKPEIDLIKARLRRAEEHHAEWRRREERKS